MIEIFMRAISGAVFVSVVVFSIIFDSNTFFGLFFLFMLIAVFEFSRMLESKNIWIYIITSVLFFYNYINLSDKNAFVIEALIILIILFLFIKQLFNKKYDVCKELGTLFLIIIYACVPFIFITKIPFINESSSYEKLSILGIFILIWSNDTFSYIIGKTIGKHKLIERISPKKTIEGFVGGFIFTLITAYFISLYFRIFSAIQWLFIGIIVSILGIFGDLVASMFKRQKGFKDTGKIIPWHGGIIDRLDSTIFICPSVYLYLKFTL